MVRVGAQTYKTSKTPQVLSSLEQVEVDGNIVRYSNYVDGQDAAPNLTHGSGSYANMFVGSSAGEMVEKAVRTTAFGNFAIREGEKLYSVTAYGTNALQYCRYGDRIVSIGDNSGKNIGNSQVSGRHGYFRDDNPQPQFDALWPAWRDYAGSVAAPNFQMTEADYLTRASHIVAVGRNALGFAITPIDCTAVGYDAATSALNGNSVTAVGCRTMQLTIKANHTTAIGNGAMRSVMDSLNDIVIGSNATNGFVHTVNNTVIGTQAMQGDPSRLITDTPAGNVVIGRQAGQNMKGNASDNVIIGHQAGNVATGNQNVLVGAAAGSNLAAGTGNTAIGRQSLRQSGGR